MMSIHMLCYITKNIRQYGQGSQNDITADESLFPRMASPDDCDVNFPGGNGKPTLLEPTLRSHHAVITHTII